MTRRRNPDYLLDEPTQKIKISKTHGGRLITEREYHINMLIGCSLCFGLGFLAAVIVIAVSQT